VQGKHDPGYPIFRYHENGLYGIGGARRHYEHSGPPADGAYTRHALHQPMLTAAGFEIASVEFEGRLFGTYTCVKTGDRHDG
jgi:hypothetical protein